MKAKIIAIDQETGFEFKPDDSVRFYIEAVLFMERFLELQVKTLFAMMKEIVELARVLYLKNIKLSILQILDYYNKGGIYIWVN